MGKPERLARTIIYQNPWVNLYADRVRMPQGRLVEQHHVLEFEKEAVGAVVVNEVSQVLLVRAYRYVTDSIEWEIPAGGIEPGEDILLAGQREVREESGYETVEPRLIYTYYPMNGMANKVFHVIRCRATTGSGEFDGNEIESFQWFSRQTLKEMIAANLIRDGYTLTGLLLELSR
jgi:ADP-ribose pyrophosphatase